MSDGQLPASPAKRRRVRTILVVAGAVIVLGSQPIVNLAVAGAEYAPELPLAWTKNAYRAALRCR